MGWEAYCDGRGYKQRPAGARAVTPREGMAAGPRAAVGVERRGKFKKVPDPRNDRICGVIGCQE